MYKKRLNQGKEKSTSAVPKEKADVHIHKYHKFGLQPMNSGEKI